MTETVRIGVVGCGGIARGHRAAYEATGQATIVAAYDPVPDAANAFADACGATAAATIEAMIEQHALDAVSICSPPSAHLANAVPFLEAGIPVLCEKPLERTAAGALALFRAAEQSGTLFMTAYCHRFHPAILELKSLIERGTLGAPLLSRITFGGHFPLAGNHRADAALSGGGCIMDNASHATDLFRMLVGDPTHVQAFSANVMQDIEVEDFGLIHLAVGQKVFGEITVSYSLKVCAATVEWYGTEGTGVVTYFDPAHPDLVFRGAADEAWTTVDCSGHPERFDGEIAHFLACVRDGARPAVTAGDGLKVSQIIETVYESARTGQRLAVGYET